MLIPNTRVMKELAVLAIYGLLLRSVDSANFTCIPENDCAIAGSGAKVPEASDCTKYYVCTTNPSGDVVPSPSSFSCPCGQYFDTTIKDCITGSCTELPCPGFVPDNICRTTCPTNATLFIKMAEFSDGSSRSTAVIGDVTDCSSYYICIDEVPAFHDICPSSTPYFDGVTCVADPSQCCNFCQAYCWDANTLIQDPLDCTSYYLCTATGIVNSLYHSSCPSGQYFDPSTYECLAGTCTNICSTSTITTSSATIPAGYKSL